MGGRMRCLLLVFVYIAFFSVGTVFAVEADSGVVLENGDCVKCHAKEVMDVKANGARHLTEVTCLDCHAEHPPSGTDTIPQCSQCHDPQEKKHFTVAGCIKCHYPHYPLQMNFAAVGDELKPVCLTCHEPQGIELAKYPSKHSQMSCSECHPKHGEFKECLACHDGHGDAGMTYQDCLRCHKPHMPTLVKYDTSIPSPFCAACHDKEFGLLDKNQTKHHELTCVYCHKNQHKVVPECEICHGLPHGDGIHKKFASCLDCHADAHALVKN